MATRYPSGRHSLGAHPPSSIQHYYCSVKIISFPSNVGSDLLCKLLVPRGLALYRLPGSIYFFPDKKIKKDQAGPDEIRCNRASEKWLKITAQAYGRRTHPAYAFDSKQPLAPTAAVLFLLRRNMGLLRNFLNAIFLRPGIPGSGDPAFGIKHSPLSGPAYFFERQLRHTCLI